MLGNQTSEMQIIARKTTGSQHSASPGFSSLPPNTEIRLFIELLILSLLRRGLHCIPAVTLLLSGRQGMEIWSNEPVVACPLEGHVRREPANIRDLFDQRTELGRYASSEQSNSQSYSSHR